MHAWLKQERTFIPNVTLKCTVCLYYFLTHPNPNQCYLLILSSVLIDVCFPSAVYECAQVRKHADE